VRSDFVEALIDLIAVSVFEFGPRADGQRKEGQRVAPVRINAEADFVIRGERFVE